MCPLAGKEIYGVWLVTDALSTSISPFTHATCTSHSSRAVTTKYAVGSETKAEDRPDTSSHHSQGLDKTRYRILQIRCQYVCHTQSNRWRRATHSLAPRVLFQRGVYPSDDFQMVKKYGQTVLITQDAALEAYLDKFVFTSSVSAFVFVNGDIGY